MPKFKLTTSAQVERVYVVEASDEKQAKKRLTTWKHDPEVFAEGIIVEVGAARRDISMQRITDCTPVVVPKAVGDSSPGGKPGRTAQSRAAREGVAS